MKNKLNTSVTARDLTLSNIISADSPEFSSSYTTMHWHWHSVEKKKRKSLCEYAPYNPFTRLLKTLNILYSKKKPNVYI